MFHGAASQSIATVTAYSSLGLSGLQHALVSTSAAALFVDADSISRLQEILESASCLRLVVYAGSPEACTDSIDKLKTCFDQVKFIHFDDICLAGQHNPIPLNAPNADDLCAIFYTSGSTGNPKGVPMKHKNVVAAG